MNYFILSFLPPLKIIRLGQLNRRFYELYVPVTLSTLTVAGSLQCSNTRRNNFALRIESSPNLLTLQIPNKKKDAKYQDRPEKTRKDFNLADLILELAF